MLRFASAVALLALPATASAQCLCGSPPVPFAPAPVAFAPAPTYLLDHAAPVSAPGYTPPGVAGPVGGLLDRLNTPFVPGMPTIPGVANPSALGLLSPRLSIANNFIHAGGFTGPDAGRFVVGTAFPRAGTVLALQSGQLTPTQAALGLMSPRAQLLSSVIGR